MIGYIYDKPDGDGMAVFYAMPKDTLEPLLGPMTEDNYMAFVIGKSLPPGVKQILIINADWKPPEGREFRNAWVITDDGRVVVDMPKARDIQRDRLREARVPEFAALDVTASLALVSKDLIEAAKQRLRDVPAHPAIEAAATPEALAAITLDVIMGR